MSSARNSSTSSCGCRRPCSLTSAPPRADPTPAELFQRYQTELARAGYYWDIDQENPEPIDPNDETTVLVSFDDGGLDRLEAYAGHGITIGDWLTFFTRYAEDEDRRPRLGPATTTTRTTKTPTSGWA